MAYQSRYPIDTLAHSARVTPEVKYTLYKPIDQNNQYIKEGDKFCLEILSTLIRRLEKDFKIKTEVRPIGGDGARLIVQNDQRPIALDYSLVILNRDKIRGSDKKLKDRILKTLNSVLNAKDWSLGKMADMGYSDDSTSALTSPPLLLVEHTFFKFYFAITIVYEDSDGWRRLIKERSKGKDKYTFVPVPDSKGVYDRFAEVISAAGGYELLTELYVKLKNKYRSGKAGTPHPSFACFVEAVNDAHGRLRQQRKTK